MPDIDTSTEAVEAMAKAGEAFASSYLRCFGRSREYSMLCLMPVILRAIAAERDDAFEQILLLREDAVYAEIQSLLAAQNKMISDARREAFEEAAKIAETLPTLDHWLPTGPNGEGEQHHVTVHGPKIAAAIRAKSSEAPNG